MADRHCWWCHGRGYVEVEAGGRIIAEGPCGRCHPERKDAVHPPYAATKVSQ